MNYDGKTYRNLEGQVKYLTEVAEALDNRITEVAANIPSKMIVEELPEEGDPNITYYVGPKGTAPNYYYEVWVWVQEVEDGPFVWRELEDTDQVDLSGYLPKVTGDTTYAQVYVKNADGTQGMVDAVNDNYTANSIARRDSGGRIKAANPVSWNDVVIKDYAENNFVAKSTSTTTYDRLYGVYANGTQTMFNVSEGANAYTIAMRDSAGKLLTKDPVNSSDAVNKSYGDSTYLAKVTGASTYQQVYGKYTDGGQLMMNAAVGQVGNALVQRNASGQIYVPATPTEYDHAASKQYVDASVGQLIYKHQITLTFTVSSKLFQLDIVVLNGTSTAYTSTDGKQMLANLKSSSYSISTSSYVDNKFWSVVVCPSDKYIHDDTGVGFLLEAGSDGTTIYVDGIDPNYNANITGVTISDVVTTW